MGFQYAVLGAGRQGTAAAYDLAKFGDADRVVLLDRNPGRAADAARMVSDLLGSGIVEGEVLDVRDGGAVQERLAGVDSTLSAVPYFFNPSIAFACVHAGSHMCDLGGNTDVTKRTLSLDDEARRAGVCIIPDCGLAPGLCNNLAAYGMTYMEEVDDVSIRCGGLPQDPKPPLFYKIVFNIVGLTDEYFGEANFLRDGRVVKVETFTELEELEFDQPIGKCECFVIAGPTSTCPWSFEGSVRSYDYKAIRYPGHYARFKVIRDLGLLDLEPIELHGKKIIPRDVFHSVVAPKLTFPEDKDLVVLRVTVVGRKEGQSHKMIMEVMDLADEETGFTAMQRTTGWSASIIAIMMAQGEVTPGATPLETSIDGRRFVELFKKRGIRFTESLQRSTGGE